MQLGLQKPDAMKTLDTQRQLVRPLPGETKTSQPRSEAYVSNFRASENLTHLKLSAEKMIQEQACMKTDLQIAHSKLEKSEREVRHLETKLQDTNNENAILRVKQQEVIKLWEGLESKISSTKTFCDQLTDSLQQLALEVQEAEQVKQVLDEKLAERAKFYEGLKVQIADLSSKKEDAEITAEKWQSDYTQLKKQQEDSKHFLAQEVARCKQLQLEKAELEIHLQASKESCQGERAILESFQKQLEQVQREFEMKVHELTDLQERHVHLTKIKNEIYIQAEDFKDKLASEKEKNAEFKGEIERLMKKEVELEKNNAVALGKLLVETARCNECAQEERRAKEDARISLKELNVQHQELILSKNTLERELQEFKEKLRGVSERYDKSQTESTEKLKALEEKVNITNQKFEELVNDKHELETRAQVMQSRIASLLTTMEELKRSKEELTVANLQMQNEISTVSENARQVIQKQSEELEVLMRKVAEDAELLSSHENEKIQFRETCSENNEVIARLSQEQKHLHNQYAEALTQKAAAERLSLEIRRQAETQLEVQQMDLKKHIKEISERNDKEMKDMRRKYEAETTEAILKGEQKARSMLETMKTHHESEIAKIQEAALAKQRGSHEEHQAQIREILQKQEKDKKMAIEELNKNKHDFIQMEQQKLWTQELELKIEELQRKHNEEIRKVQADKLSQCSNAEERALNLEKQVNVLKKQLEEKLQREVDLKASLKKCEEAVHNFEADRNSVEENHKKTLMVIQSSLQEELDEIKKKALFWEVKYKSLESSEKKSKAGKGRVQESTELAKHLMRSEKENNMCLNGPSTVNEPLYGKQNSNATEKGKCESVSLPTHSRTVTHHEYEVATSDGRKTITRHKRTKSTVMFEEQSSVPPLSMKRMGRRKSTRISSQHRKQIKPSRVYASTMGDLFGGKSLDPYVDDPYAFH